MAPTGAADDSVTYVPPWCGSTTKRRVAFSPSTLRLQHRWQVPGDQLVAPYRGQESSQGEERAKGNIFFATFALQEDKQEPDASSRYRGQDQRHQNSRPAQKSPDHGQEFHIAQPHTLTIEKHLA